MKINDLKNILFVNRIILLKENEIGIIEEIHYILWSKDQTIYELQERFSDFESNDLFDNHGDEEIYTIEIENNVAYISIEM